MRRKLCDFYDMNALLEVPAIRERAMKFSVEDYHRFTEGQPTELLRGTIIEKMSRSPLHYATFQRLRRILSRCRPVATCGSKGR